jgi:hypothetical protein
MTIHKGQVSGSITVPGYVDQEPFEGTFVFNGSSATFNLSDEVDGSIHTLNAEIAYQRVICGLSGVVQTTQSQGAVLLEPCDALSRTSPLGCWTGEMGESTFVVDLLQDGKANVYTAANGIGTSVTATYEINGIDLHIWSGQATPLKTQSSSTVQFVHFVGILATGGHYVLDCLGQVHPFGGALWWGDLNYGFDIARDLEVAPNGWGYAILDGYGSVGGFGSMQSICNNLMSTNPFYGQDLARDLELTFSGQGWHILNGYGDIASVGDAGPLVNPARGETDVFVDLERSGRLTEAELRVGFLVQAPSRDRAPEKSKVTRITPVVASNDAQATSRTASETALVDTPDLSTGTWNGQTPSSDGQVEISLVITAQGVKASLIESGKEPIELVGHATRLDGKMLLTLHQVDTDKVWQMSFSSTDGTEILVVDKAPEGHAAFRLTLKQSQEN